MNVQHIVPSGHFTCHPIRDTTLCDATLCDVTLCDVTLCDVTISLFLFLFLSEIISSVLLIKSELCTSGISFTLKKISFTLNH